MNQKEKVINQLQGRSLRDFIIWLDTKCCKVERNHFLYQVMARSMIALGYHLLSIKHFDSHHPIRVTIRAAEDYALSPTEDHWDELVRRATNSYPFGPGDGCFSLSDSSFNHGEPGEGCRSGAGSLASLGIKDEMVMELLKEEIIPWLHGDADPVISKNRHCSE